MTTPALRPRNRRRLLLLLGAALVGASGLPIQATPSADSVNRAETSASVLEHKFQQATLLLDSERAEDKAEGERLLQQCAEAGFGPACGRLGQLILARANNQKVPLQQAWQWFTRGAEAKDIPSMIGLARLVDRYGRLDIKYQDATRLLRQVLELDPNNVFAHEKLAELVGSRARTGNVRLVSQTAERTVFTGGAAQRTPAEIQRDQAEELFHLTTASRLGSAHAAFLLARRARQGVDGVIDPAQARVLAALAAERGDPRGDLLLGELFERGEGGSIDLPAAAASYQAAAEKGLSDGALRLAEFLRYGYGRPRDLAEAIRWLEARREPNWLSWCTLYVDIQLERGDHAGAVRMLESLRGNIDPAKASFALERLSLCHENGWSVKRAPGEAAGLLTQAIRFGNADALTRQARQLLAKGSHAKAVSLLESATQDGRITKVTQDGKTFEVVSAPSPAGCYVLGRLLLEGKKVRAAPERGWALINQAAALHQREALCFAASATVAGTSGAPSDAIALRYATEAEKVGAVEAAPLRATLEQRLAHRNQP